jgi:hypothetical protein
VSDESGADYQAGGGTYKFPSQETYDNWQDNPKYAGPDGAWFQEPVNAAHFAAQKIEDAVIWGKKAATKASEVGELILPAAIVVAVAVVATKVL